MVQQSFNLKFLFWIYTSYSEPTPLETDRRTDTTITH